MRRRLPTSPTVLLQVVLLVALCLPLERPFLDIEAKKHRKMSPGCYLFDMLLTSSSTKSSTTSIEGISAVVSSVACAVSTAFSMTNK